MNYYPLVLRNLETLMKMNDEGGPLENDERSKFKIKAYEKAIKKLPTDINDVLTKNIAGHSIMGKINKIIKTNSNLPEVTKYLEMEQLINSREDSESSDESEDEFENENDDSDNEIVVGSQFDQNGESSEEESEEESDNESECQHSLSEMKTLLKLEKHILDLNLQNQIVKDMFSLILKYKKELIQQVL
jgi:hypothetical protein